MFSCSFERSTTGWGCRRHSGLFEDGHLEAATGLGADIVKRIQSTRRELLDLSARNRLISTPRGSSQGRKIEVVDERSEEVFRILVRERKAMSFLPGAGEGEEDRTPTQCPAIPT